MTYIIGAHDYLPSRGQEFGLLFRFCPGFSSFFIVIQRNSADF